MPTKFESPPPSPLTCFEFDKLQLFFLTQNVELISIKKNFLRTYGHGKKREKIAILDIKIFLI